jgi:uncharacterized repeat protein (TIGR01451 family)
MKRILRNMILVLSLAFGLQTSVKAQLVYIPDSAFRAFLYQDYPSCMIGDSIDPTCPDILTAPYIDVTYRGIEDLTGIEVFVKDSILNCGHNLLTSLPTLPPSLDYLICNNNQLTNLPVLPPTVQVLVCSDNQITNLPTLPIILRELICNNNQLTTLPALPTPLWNLECFNNQLTSLPSFPPALIWVKCNNNPIACLPDLKNVTELSFDSTLINCLPSYGFLTFSSPPLSSIPICELFNSNSCDVFWNIEGTDYIDLDTNCIFGNSENGIANLKMNFFKNGVLDQQTYTNKNGDYDFDTFSNDFYRVELDTNGLPFVVNCPIAGFYLDTISATDSIKYDRDFALKCKGVDLEATSIFMRPPVPASLRTIYVQAGNLSNFYGVNCANGISGTVTITITGACNYVSSPSYALTPTTAIGNVLTYSITDFGAISYDSTFDFNLLIDTTAVLGSQICISVNVTTAFAELNYSNNLLSRCFTVIGSYDPNDKAVYPQRIMEVNSDRWLNYTIRFQNTGTAEAENIYITDTLSNMLDISTFTMLSYSHEPFVQLYNDGLLKFNFPNINLPDSNSNEPESHGYIQYKIRAKDSLVVGSTIDNTANIFFDFNAPVITNTTSNTVINCSLLQATITQTASTLETNLPNANYQWINCTTGTAIVGANTQTFNPTLGGIYAVVVDFGTCIDTSNCFGFSGIGINEINASNISIQPNPFNNELKVTLDKNVSGVLEVYNTIGALITCEKLQSRNVTLNTSNWNAGVYILKVATNDGVVVKKVVKR